MRPIRCRRRRQSQKDEVPRRDAPSFGPSSRIYAFINALTRMPGKGDPWTGFQLCRSGPSIRQPPRGLSSSHRDCDAQHGKPAKNLLNRFTEILTLGLAAYDFSRAARQRSMKSDLSSTGCFPTRTSSRFHFNRLWRLGLLGDGRQRYKINMQRLEEVRQ